MKIHLICMLMLSSFSVIAQTDPYLWLEEVDGKKALEFVEKHNKSTIEKLSAHKEYQPIYNKSLAILNSNERLVSPTIYGKFIYNFWQDKEHPIGIWRRSTQESYLSGKPEWITLLDIDELSKKENVKWVYKSATGLYPEYDRFMVSLSKGGGDAVVTKEFDVNTRSFINDFSIGESKGSANYLDRNTLIVSSNFGNGSMTTSGYPRQVKLWKRGTAMKDAQLIYEGETSDVGVRGYVLRDGDRSYLMIHRSITFFTGQSYIWLNNKPYKLDIPDNASIRGLQKDQLIVLLKSDWNENGTTFKQGSLVSIDFPLLQQGKKDIRLIYEPNELSSITSVSTTKNKLLVNILKDVMSELNIYTFEGDKWDKHVVKAGDFGVLNIVATDEFSDKYFFNYTNFLTPSSLFSANADDKNISLYKALPSFFDASKYKVEQFKATAKDGVKVPYFVVSAINTVYNGKNPTLMYAYGGFEVPSLPSYMAITANSWLEYGGVYVLANIRGGGEYGPKWHQAGLKEKRQVVFDDFYSIAEDIIAKKITSPAHLGIYGGSNGGLLVGTAFTQRPELFNAVVCAVPLLDMKRYSKLLAGASWIGEYGDPEKEDEWEYIRKYSPYHNLKENVNYPEVYFYTSTRDDRVHPGHARKMVAKMSEMGKQVYYHENIEGGHAGSTTNEQRAQSTALMYSYLLMKLK